MSDNYIIEIAGQCRIATGKPRDTVTLYRGYKPWKLSLEEANNTLGILEDPGKGLDFLNSMHGYRISLMPYESTE